MLRSVRPAFAGIIYLCAFVFFLIGRSSACVGAPATQAAARK